MAKAKYYVMDERNSPSWDSDTDEAESFSALSAAKSRAVEIAGYNPGEEVHICKSVEIVTCPVGDAVSETVA